MSRMPTFIDESGDTGHSQTSSPYFRLAAVWMPSAEEANAFREAVRRLRQDRPDLHLEAGFEFKFAKTHGHPGRREAFFALAMRHPFKFAVCAIDKTQGHWRRAPAREQHWATATDLAVSLRSAYHEAEAVHPDRPLQDPLIVDDNQDKNFLETIRAAFQGLRSRTHPEIPMIRSPRFRGSKPDEVLHLVDMICGAAGAFIDGNSAWYDVIKPRCLGLTRLP
jgi:hypothetical protein